jgi:hypothetical protein
MSEDYKAHQQELAQSGYRIPDSFYADVSQASQQSAEQESGDGGRANAEIDPADSEHGYKGALLSQQELATKLGTGPVQNKSAAVGTTGGAAATGAGGVQYASSAAEEAATGAGLTATDFAGVDPSSENGYTKADVQKVIDGKQS